MGFLFLLADNPPDMKTDISQLKVKEEVCETLPVSSPPTIEGITSIACGISLIAFCL